MLINFCEFHCRFHSLKWNINLPSEAVAEATKGLVNPVAQTTTSASRAIRDRSSAKDELNSSRPISAPNRV